MDKLKKSDTAALSKGIPEKKRSKGQVGAIAEKLDPDTCKVEFPNAKGETIVTLPLKKAVSSRKLPDN